jgi:acyl CoA:acetate/3-ketoacid CoA transferase
MKSKIITFEEAARLIPDRAVVSISSSSGLNTPDRMLASIGARFDAEGHPRDLTTPHPIGTGDMYGIKGIDHIARKGLLKRTIAGSFPSGPSSMDSPLIWQMIMANEVEAYNVPSGILFDMHREVAQRRAGVMTRVGLHTFVDPRLDGCRMNDAARGRGVDGLGLGLPLAREIARAHGGDLSLVRSPPGQVAFALALAA